MKVETIEYLASVRLPLGPDFSLAYTTTRPINDNWGTKQSEVEFYLNGISVSRKELPVSITDSFIAELIATACIVSRRSYNVTS